MKETIKKYLSEDIIGLGFLWNSIKEYIDLCDKLEYESFKDNNSNEVLFKKTLNSKLLDIMKYIKNCIDFNKEYIILVKFRRSTFYMDYTKEIKCSGKKLYEILLSKSIRYYNTSKNIDENSQVMDFIISVGLEEDFKEKIKLDSCYETLIYNCGHNVCNLIRSGHMTASDYDKYIKTLSEFFNVSYDYIIELLSCSNNLVRESVITDIRKSTKIIYDDINITINEESIGSFIELFRICSSKIANTIEMDSDNLFIFVNSLDKMFNRDNNLFILYYETIIKNKYKTKSDDFLYFIRIYSQLCEYINNFKTIKTKNINKFINGIENQFIDFLRKDDLVLKYFTKEFLCNRMMTNYKKSTVSLLYYINNIIEWDKKGYISLDKDIKKFLNKQILELNL